MSRELTTPKRIFPSNDFHLAGKSFLDAGGMWVLLLEFVCGGGKWITEGALNSLAISIRFQFVNHSAAHRSFSHILLATVPSLKFLMKGFDFLQASIIDAPISSNKVS